MYKVTVSHVLPRHVLDKLDDLADREKVTRSEMLRHIIMWYIAYIEHDKGV